MPNLTDDQLKAVTHGVLNARMNGDEDAMFAALTPLEDEGDYGDAYLLAVALITIVKLALPPQVCPEHGPDGDCKPLVGIGIVGVDADTGDMVAVGDADTAGEFASVTPEIEQQFPDVIGFMRMLAAEINDDEDMSIALWHAAVAGDYADRILFTAIDNAAEIVRAGRAALQ